MNRSFKLTALPVIFGALALGLSTQARAAFPDGPVELVCSTKPGSGAASWCHLVAEHLKLPEFLGVPVNVTFKSGGSNNEPAVYVQSKPADCQTLFHISGSFTGYFNLPHFTYGYKDYILVARMEQHLYAVSVHADRDFKTYQDLVAYAKANPNKLSMGSNKVGSIHHRHQELLHKTAGIKIRFVPYQGTGGVVKDVMGKHLDVGFAQPGKWLPHIKAGKARSLLLLNEKRLDHPLYKDVPVPSDLGLDYDIPHQFQGFMVKAGTPSACIETLQGALRKISATEKYQSYLATQPHVVPNYEDDIGKLDSEFSQGLKDTRVMMIDLEIIKP